MIYFLIYLFLEVMISSSIATNIGGLNTFFEIIVSAIIGIYLLKNFKFSLMESINEARSGNITQEEFIKTNVAKAFGAVLLIVPGFFTDFLGIALQFGLFTIFLTKIFKFKKNTKNTNSEYSSHQNTHFEYKHTNFNNTQYKGKDDEIIDVEVIDDSKSIK
ncbi:MAG: FxsA family protein [Campylobacterota bacterium]|nr:FxsA family protein [Campylobacterota bacterium]